MRQLPFSGRLDVVLACLLVVERHGSVANRCVARGELTSDLLSLVDDFEVPPECLCDLDAFEVEVERALLRLADAGWIEDRTARGTPLFAPRPVAEDVLAWIRSRLMRDAGKTAAFDRLHEAVTARVLADYGHAVPSRDAARRT
jgi:hypothetical protein